MLISSPSTRVPHQLCLCSPSIQVFPPSKQKDIMAPLCAHGDLTAMMMSFSRAPLAASHVRQVSLVIALHHRPQSGSLCLTQPSYTNIMRKYWTNHIFITSLTFPRIFSWCAAKLLMLICAFKCLNKNATHKENVMKLQLVHITIWGLCHVQMWQRH